MGVASETMRRLAHFIQIDSLTMNRTIGTEGRTATDHLRCWARAVDEIAENTSATTWGDVGPHLTCREADSVARAFDALGLSGLATALRQGHADADAQGDSHYRGEA